MVNQVTLLDIHRRRSVQRRPSKHKSGSESGSRLSSSSQLVHSSKSLASNPSSRHSSPSRNESRGDSARSRNQSPVTVKKRGGRRQSIVPSSPGTGKRPNANRRKSIVGQQKKQEGKKSAASTPRSLVPPELREPEEEDHDKLTQLRSQSEGSEDEDGLLLLRVKTR